MTLELISFNLCPFVQGSVITLEEKGVDYRVKYIDLHNKPEWFAAISPFGKVPVLKVDDTVLSESAVINEYVDESTPGSLLPTDPLDRAVHRVWIEFASSLGATSFRLMMSPSREEATKVGRAIEEQLQRIENQVQGPYWAGDTFQLVDAAFAPMLQRIDWCLKIAPELACFERTPKAAAYRDKLLQRPSVARSLPEGIEEVFAEYIAGRGTPSRNAEPVWLHSRRKETLESAS